MKRVPTSTGRLSTNEPNLQNIPVSTEMGRRIRAAVLKWLRLARTESQLKADEREKS